MIIGVLTSSRADFGIYTPLLLKLEKDSFFHLEIIAFGTHLSKAHGYTIKEIEGYGFKTIHQIQSLPKSDSPFDIASCIAYTSQKFAAFWNENNYDLVIALGDRYEMFAAVAAASPFNIEIAHIHAGETTLGAIDNAYRHSISLFSKYLFVSTEKYKKRAEEIVKESAEVFNVGALSIENLKNIDYLSKKALLEKFDVDLSKPTILSTFHPETVGFENNKKYIKELLSTFDELKKNYQIVITMPNTDTMGTMVRNEINEYGKGNSKIKIIESFGMIAYLSCMKYCSFMLGNTSSGFVEASFFPKYVINIGKRQDGRIITKNIVNCEINKTAILEAVNSIENSTSLKAIDSYGSGNTSSQIINILKNIYEN